MYQEFEKLIGDFNLLYKPGERISGNVLKVDNRGAMVDIGGKAPAFVPTAELSIAPISEPSDVISPGTTREFVVVGSNSSQEVTLSIRKLELEVVWQRLRQCLDEDITVEGTVYASNRGGVMVDVMGVRGFVPVSQLSPMYSKDDMTGQVIPMKVIDVDETSQKLVLSNRRVEGVSEEGAAAQQSMSPGDVVEGTVTAVKPYGAFVDMGGISGLLHISQMTAERITNINNVIAPGDKIKVMVLGLDKEKNRFALSTKKLEPAPGDFIRNPQVVFDRAEEMAALFKDRISATENVEKEAEA